MIDLTGSTPKTCNQLSFSENLIDGATVSLIRYFKDSYSSPMAYVSRVAYYKIKECCGFTALEAAAICEALIRVSEVNGKEDYGAAADHPHPACAAGVHHDPEQLSLFGSAFSEEKPRLLLMVQQ
ncbi:hypothetical protein cyc_05192 [Cyclospora cayetanensis]|uniref:Uncharacterized protein n=1 Tax=Cyclospora cayetanensis TaxID=88456 RepID=A0A1D3CVU7_9EIME|nr:hypothetical protein cyc_05192 [Cyclospora cayetanensis]